MKGSTQTGDCDRSTDAHGLMTDRHSLTRAFSVSKYRTIAATSAGTVYSAGMIVVATLHWAAASAVSGPIDATMVPRRRSAAGSAPRTRTKLRTADALVNVTTSMLRSSSIR